MRSRVAFYVTLIALLVLSLLFFYNCSRLAEEENVDRLEWVDSICNVVSGLTRNDSQQVRAEAVSVISAGPGIEKALFSADGEALYASGGLHTSLTQDEIAAARVGAVVSNKHKDAEGKIALYAIYQYEDGAFLVIETRGATVFSVMTNNHALMLFGLVFGLTMVCFIVVLSYERRKEYYLNSVMRALDRFSDGDFDARIEGFSKDNPEVAEYNAIIARIQERIFRQRNRNHVLSTVMSQMQNGIIAVDENLHVIFVTSVAKRLLGIVGNAEGLHVSDASKDVKLDTLFNEAMRQEGVYTNEVAARTAVGRGHRPLRLYVSAMKQDGYVVGALAIVEDITELRRLEEVRSDFAANVSHELKTPLTSIQGFVETLEAGAIDNPQMAHKFLRIIKVETERLTRLINDILSISKLESGDTEVATERIRLDKKAHDVCEMLSIHAADKQVTINSHLNHEPVYIIGNPDRVEQLLINLTENAIKYNQPGGSVTVQVFANQNEANITISDTGIGIAEENLPRLFERFYRVDKGRSRQMGGTGLGLAIVKHIVRSMGGEIEVHSKLGEGTEFLITLPLAPKMNPDKDSIFDDD
ncbi:MAG: PAS domain S-box protein [Clostridia bacterium]|nr:PAS domain S-box protein [Clostridia bacterium]